MRLRTIAFLAAMVPVTVAAEPNKNRTDDQKDQQSEIDTFEWSSSQDSRLGVMVMGLNPELRNFFGAPRDSGLLIAQVAPNSPAARAGLRVGDVITKFNGDKVRSAGDILGSISKLEKPEQVSIDVIRNHAPVTVQAMLGRQPSRSSQTRT